ncbi:TonB-dependent receptor plug domain-containing protein [Azonexus caeni]|jgi:iron complex outermembrane receptor protein|uniref:TonB-dependent receptor plug domain-containing protein n=1 Tax=Azonexus caeni TaxID=266126 RepID=UPI003A83ABCD
MKRRRYLSVLVCMLPFGTLLAEDELFFAELPVVASVSRLPQRLADAPASVTVIDREMIRASGYRSLNDLFRLVPGFQTFAHSDVGARVNYHGITDDNDFSPRVQVLIDGRSLHSPLFRGGVNWALIPVALEDIERIEVVRGSNSVSYGTNAFLGVVNIVTIDPSLVRGVSVSASRGTQGVNDYSVRGGGKLGETGNFRLSYQQTSDDGLKGNYDWEDSYRNRRFDARFDYAVNLRDSLEFSLGKVEGRFLSGSLDKVTRLSDPCDDPLRNRDESSTWMQARWLRALSETADFSLRYTFSEDRGDNAYRIDPVTCGVVPYPKVNESGDWGRRHEIEATHNFVPMAKTRLVWGASWRHDEMSSQTMMRGRGTEARQVWRAFANGEWKPSTWLTANLGASNEYDTLAGNHLSPRASIAFHLTPENTLRLGYTQAWRTASILAYRGNYVAVDGSETIFSGNSRLPAERLDSWEVAYLGNWRQWRMSLDVRHFRETVRDRLMAVRPAKDAPDSEQSIQDIRIAGYELQWRWQPLESTRLLINHASLRVNSELSGNGWVLVATEDSSFHGLAAIKGGGGFEPEYAVYQRLAEGSAPRRSSSLMWMQKLPAGFDFSVMRYWVDAIKWTRNTDAEKYQRTDARLAYNFKFAGQRGELAYTAQSLEGRHAEQRKSGTKPNGRYVDQRHWITLRLDF